MHTQVWLAPGPLFLHAALHTGPAAPFIRLQNFLRKKAVLRPPCELLSLRANVLAKELVSDEQWLAGVASSAELGNLCSAGMTCPFLDFSFFQ